MAIGNKTYENSIKEGDFAASLNGSDKTSTSFFNLPPVFAIDERQNGNTIQQLTEPSCAVKAAIAGYKNPQLKGKLIIASDGDGEILIVEKFVQVFNGFSRVMQAKLSGLENSGADLSGAKWLKHPQLSNTRKESIQYEKRLAEVLNSWEGAFTYITEDQAKGRKGLRAPQIGAVHRIQAHWSVSNEAATIVMPTGTGKTETMLSVLVSTPCQRVLVIVPTDALRTQIAEKFLTLGILKDKDCYVLAENALRPIVGILRQIPKSVAEVDSLFERCNVVVTTAQIAGQCNDVVQKRMAFHCPYLFIDEAHHTPAPKWAAFKSKFVEKRILQFTATPFREDSKPVDGKIIYKYPLKKAQDEGYFRPIQFKRIFEFDPAKADKVIAAQAVEQLRQDAAQGYNHILMARVGRVQKAQEVFSIYAQYEEFNPVLIHSRLPDKERERIRRQLLSGTSRIVVCVDMLGEGFDLPELKIAAFHDIRKSLAITLQVAGRFTRSRPDLGQATFIANIADVQVRDELKRLYTNDPDWNALLPELSEEVIQEQVTLQEFIEGFANFPPDIPLKNVHPAMSTVIYKTKCANWTPENFGKGIPGIGSFERVHSDINHEKNTLIIVTAHKVPVDWANIKEIFNWDWELTIVFWDRGQNLLFINNSHNSGEYRKLARAVAGEDVELINEQTVFRCLAGINRVRLQNVGLTEQLNRSNQHWYTRSATQK